jgi:hypothetical protein
MKNVMLALIAIVCMSSCKAQSTTDPDTSSTMSADAKCLLGTQWSFDRNIANIYPEDYWFQDPNLGFSSATEGYLFVGFQKGKYKNNQFNIYAEMYFTYTINKDKLVFNITKIKNYKGFTTFVNEETGQEAINTAKDLMFMLHQGNGIKFTCAGRKLKFDAAESSTKVPFKVYNWNRTN